jgi:hypothetical protein
MNRTLNACAGSILAGSISGPFAQRQDVVALPVRRWLLRTRPWITLRLGLPATLIVEPPRLIDLSLCRSNDGEAT